MRALVTGAAGFIGSHLSDYLIANGHEVTGIDNFVPYYDPVRKEANLAGIRAHPRFRLIRSDLAETACGPLIEGIDTVFHFAAQPGVRSSWSTGFDGYLRANVTVTQRLLEAAKTAGLRRFVYASSSSVYGRAARFPTWETDRKRPHSPYGVSKLAGEHLVRVYAENYGLPTVSLRFFTVYGPRQRPDMAIHRLMEAALRGRTFPLYGAADYIRDFTYVDDIVRAAVSAAERHVPPATALNIAGGEATTMAATIELLTVLIGQPIQVEDRGSQPGDVERTGGAIENANEVLGWRPRVGLQSGLEAQLAWHRTLGADRNSRGLGRDGG